MPVLCQGGRRDQAAVGGEDLPRQQSLMFFLMARGPARTWPSPSTWGAGARRALGRPDGSLPSGCLCVATQSSGGSLCLPTAQLLVSKGDYSRTTNTYETLACITLLMSPWLKPVSHG